MAERGPEGGREVPEGWSAPDPSAAPPAGQPAYGPAPTFGPPVSFDKAPAYGQGAAYGEPAYGEPAYGQYGQYGQGGASGGPLTAPPGWGGPVLGAAQPGVVPLRPLGLSELLDGSVNVVRRYPRPTLGLSAVVAVITGLLGLLLLTAIPSGLFEDLNSSSSSASDLSDARLGGLAAGSIATLAVGGLAGLVLSGIITAVVGRAVLGQSMSTAEAWRAVRPRLLRLVGLAVLTALIVGLVLAVGLGVAVAVVAIAGPVGLLVGVPVGLAAAALSVYAYVQLSLAAPALVLEQAGIRQSLRRSHLLVRRSFWRVFGILLLAAVVAATVGQVLQVPFLLGGGGSPLSATPDLSFRALALTQLGGIVAQTITAPFTSGVRALLYIDRRMRVEGLDVALAAAAARA